VRLTAVAFGYLRDKRFLKVDALETMPAGS
jgi:hypothetical protein